MKILTYIMSYMFLACMSASANSMEQIEGVSTHANKYNMSAEEILNLIKKTGFSSVRQDFTWEDIEKEKGNYKIPDKLRIQDEIVELSSKYNIRPMIILDYGNKNYNNGGYPTSNEDIEGFANYAKWIAKRYKGKVPYYEVWNEWTVGTGMKGKGDIPNSDVYFKLVKETSIAIKEVDPAAKILAGSINPISPTGRRLKISDAQWFKQLIQEGILEYIDGISIHPYSFLNADKSLRNPEYNLSKIESFYNSINGQNNRRIPLYITEIGVPTHDGQGGMSQKEAADFIVKYVILAKSKQYIKGLWWYDLRDDGKDRDYQEHNFGFYTNDFAPKEAAYAFVNLQRALNNKKIIKVYTSKLVDNKRVTVVIEDMKNKNISNIGWAERQLIQNGRIKILNNNLINKSVPIGYDNNRLSQDVILK